MMQWALKRFNEKDMPEDLDSDIRQGLCVAFPADRAFFAKERGWHGSWPEFTVVAQGDDRLRGHVGVVERRVTVGGCEFIAGGVQNVFVIPEMKKTGLSGEILRAAVAEMAVRGYDCGLLFCLPQLEKVYAANGWRHVAGREVIRRENGESLPLPKNNITMFYPLAVERLPSGAIDLQGNDW